jgi:Nickel responsive protein SCO4226-like
VVYVVERYLPGLDQRQLVRLLKKLGKVTDDLRREGMRVRYLGSTIVPGDEACFCQFEGPSEAAVAEANTRAGVPFDRIVEAVTVPAPDSS